MSCDVEGNSRDYNARTFDQSKAEMILTSGVSFSLSGEAKPYLCEGCNTNFATLAARDNHLSSLECSRFTPQHVAYLGIDSFPPAPSTPGAASVASTSSNGSGSSFGTSSRGSNLEVNAGDFHSHVDVTSSFADENDNIPGSGMLLPNTPVPFNRNMNVKWCSNK